MNTKATLCVVMCILLSSCAMLNKDYSLGRKAEKQKDFQTSVEHYRKALEKYPESKMLRTAFIRTSEITALQYYQEYQRITGRTLKDLYKADALLVLALKYQPENAQYINARADHLQKTENQKAQILEKKNHCIQLVKANEYQQAKTLITELYSLDTEFEICPRQLLNDINLGASNYYRQKSKEKYDLRVWAEAYNLINEAIRYDNSSTNTAFRNDISQSALNHYLGIANTHLKNKKYGDALSECNKAKGFGIDDQVNNKLGELLVKIHEDYVKEAEKFALQKQWSNCDSELSKARQYGDTDLLMQATQKFNGWKRAYQLYDSAVTLSQNNNLQQAIQNLEEAKGLHPKAVDISQFLTSSYLRAIDSNYREKNYYDVINYADKALRMNPTTTEKNEVSRKKNEANSELVAKNLELFNTCVGNKYYGHAMLIGQNLVELKHEGITKELNRIADIVKQNSIQQFAVLPFKNLSYTPKSDYGSIIANMVRDEISNRPVLTKYLGFVNRDEIDLLSKEYYHRMDGIMREQDSYSEGEMIAADYLIVGSINGINFDTKRIQTEDKSVKYVVGSHKEDNPAWAKWKKDSDAAANAGDYVADQTGSALWGLVAAVATSPGSEPPKKIDVNDYAYFNYTVETWLKTATLSFDWRLIDARTSAEIQKGSHNFKVEHSDYNHPGNQQANVNSKTLNLKSDSVMETDLLKKTVSHIVNGLSKDLEQLPALLYNGASELDRLNKSVQASELMVAAYTLRPENTTYRDALTSRRNKLKILNPATYKTLSQTLSTNQKSGKPNEKSASSPNDNSEDKKLYDLILSYVVENQYDMARTMIKLFIEKHPDSQYLNSVLDLSSKIINK
ncbi:MAG: outer membrane protein assembly factor BamD [Candidatus Cloacimonetes bacterium]|nr:outer membrane protein assembly factor BamD [Candidatus Cloacimonadota bacterium]